MKPKELVTKLLNETPDAMRFQVRLVDLIFKYTDANAIPFMVVGDVVVYSTKCKMHRQMLEILASATDASQIGPKGLETDVRVDNDWLAAYRRLVPFKKGDKAIKGLRQITYSGRAWKDCDIKGEALSSVSFWTASDNTPSSYVIKVIGALLPHRTVYVEYIDSSEPFVWTDQGNLDFKHAAYTKDELTALAVRSHSQGMGSLNKKEQDALKKVRGDDAYFSQKPGLPPRFRRVIGDSLHILRAVKFLDKIIAEYRSDPVYSPQGINYQVLGKRKR